MKFSFKFRIFNMDIVIVPFQAPDVSDRLQAARITDLRFYALIKLAIEKYRSFSQSPTVSG
jgi:hypothetical protein